MTDLDDTIRRAMDAEAEHALLDMTRRETLFSELSDMLRGASRGLTIFAWFIMLLQMALAVFCAIRFFQSPETRFQIAWAIGFIMAFMGIGLLKLWFYMLAHRTKIIREIKRLELQVARLNERLSSET